VAVLELSGRLAPAGSWVVWPSYTDANAEMVSGTTRPICLKVGETLAGSNRALESGK
jgi:hypothetical protein